MNISNLDLNLLRIFAAVYADKNVTKAASRLGISQPTISNAMTRLRRSLGDPLFVRTSRGMEPTALAMRISDPVHQALALLGSAFEDPVAFEPDASTRTFRLLISDAGELAVMPALISKLSVIAPNLKVHTMIAPHSQYSELLEEGAADVAIGNLQFLRVGFYQQRLFLDQYFCVCGPHHPLAPEKKITLKQYAEFSHVGIIGGNAEGFIDQKLAKRRLQRNIQIKLSSYQAAAHVVLGSKLLATIPEQVVVPDLSAFKLPFEAPVADVRQFWHSRAHQDPAHVWFRATLASLFASRR